MHAWAELIGQRPHNGYSQGYETEMEEKLVLVSEIYKASGRQYIIEELQS